MTLMDPVRYAPDVETRRDDEAETIEALSATFDEILETTSENYGRAVRAVHAKGHGLLAGVMTIEPNLPPQLAQGLFATPGQHKVVMRLSTNAGDLLPDTIGLPRGLAIKVHDVDGERLPGAEGATQDFVLVNAPAFTAQRADQFLGNLKLLAKTTDRATGAKVVLSKVLQTVEGALEAVGLQSATLKQLGGAPNVHPLGETYFSATPFRYGAHIAKFSVTPIGPELLLREGRTIDVDAAHPDAVRDAVRSDMRGTVGLWSFRVQLCRDLERQPVEDPTVEWKPEEAPWAQVATIRVEPQDSWSDEHVRQIDEGTRFSVWTGLEAHRPLGNINRARNETYRRSAAFRERFNGCPIHEPGRGL
jgi:catalase